LCGLFPIDDEVLNWWQRRTSLITSPRPGGHLLPSAVRRAERGGEIVAQLQKTPLQADPDAPYAKRFVVDLGSLAPLVSGGNMLKAAETAEDTDVAITKAWLVSCVNARASDIRLAAQELRGKKVAPGVEFYVAAASSEVQADAELAGDWQVLVDAGAIVLPPGCGACAGLGAGTIKDGEVGIASTNRNFKGRMGSRDGVVHLASPAVVAASAAAGRIRKPSTAVDASANASQAIREVESGVERGAGPVSSTVQLAAGMPEKVEGSVLWCGADNISTDGIYHGKYMYEDLTPERMAAVTMENYDPHFRGLVAQTTCPILVSAANFGTGSSREQAAQCLKFAGIRCVIAASFSATFIRNALNNGLMVLECPALSTALRERYGGGTETNIATPTVVVDGIVSVSLQEWQVKLTVDGKEERFPVTPLGPAAQELIVHGGLHQWIQANM